jgi:hypothetical protein
MLYVLRTPSKRVRAKHHNDSRQTHLNPHAQRPSDGPESMQRKHPGYPVTSLEPGRTANAMLISDMPHRAFGRRASLAVSMAAECIGN